MNDERRRRPGIGCAVTAVAALLAASFTGPSAPPRQGPGSRGEGLVLVDLDSFYCGFCLEALLAFCRAVPARVQESRVRAVLLHRPSSSAVSDADSARIALQKWEGFRKANGLAIPALYDEGRAFRPPDKGGAAVVLLDAPGRRARTLPLPLKPKELAEVLSFLGQ